MKDKPNKLDDIIREKLAGLGSPFRPDSWNELNDRLDAMDDAASPLDNIIRSKLSNWGAPYKPESWEGLNDRLDSLEEGSPAGADMQSVDDMVYHRMHSLEKPYDPNHWPLLLKKLEANAYVGKTIIRYKAMELSLLVLLLLTLIRLPYPYKQQPLLPAQPVQAEARQAAAKPDVVANLTPEMASANLVESKNGTENIYADLPESTISEALAQKENSDQHLTKPIEEGTHKLVVDIPITTFSNTTKSSLSIPNLPTNKLDLELHSKRSLPFSLNALNTAPINESPALAMNTAAMGPLTLLSTDLMHPQCLRCSEKHNKKATITKPPTFFRIGMQGGPDYNRVITPPTRINGEIHEEDRYSLGYSGGLTFGLEKDRWEIETGLIYSNKRYYSLPVLILDGNVKDGFIGDGTKQFDLDIFQIPLNFRYNFVRKNRWRVYAMAGMSLHLTTQSNYYLSETEGFETDTFQPETGRPEQENNGRNAPSVKTEFDNFAKGWLEGGSFHKNSYISGNVGFGLEHFVTDYWSVYAQPTYRHSIIYLNGGLGPFYDRIHTTSLLFGVKVRLK